MEYVLHSNARAPGLTGQGRCPASSDGKNHHPHPGAGVPPPALDRHPFSKGTTAPVSDRPSAPGNGRNTRHPTGIRVVIALLALMCLVLGPAGYLRGLSVQAHAGSAAEWFTLAFGAAVGIPLLAAAVATVAGDRRAALWSLALLVWPVVFVVAIHLAQAL